MIHMDQGQKGRIERDQVVEDIQRWEVWFLTMRGYHTNLQSALKDAEEIDMPSELIRPVTVAISKTMYEPVHKA